VPWFSKLLVAAVVSVALLGHLGDAAAGRSFVIRASSTLMRLGDFWIEKDPTYAGAVAALGPSSSCRLVKTRFLGVDRSHAFAGWATFG
jgi:hypothetical protein